MRAFEKVIIFVATIVFVTAIGSGVFDVFIQDFEDGVDILLQLGEHSTQALIALGALVAALITFGSSVRGKKKRK